jgi:primosomal protein N'
MTFGMKLVKELRRMTKDETILLGPSSDVIKIKNSYTSSIMIKYKDEPQINSMIKSLISAYTEKDLLIRVDHFPGVG